MIIDDFIGYWFVVVVVFEVGGGRAAGVFFCLMVYCMVWGVCSVFCLCEFIKLIYNLFYRI